MNATSSTRPRRRLIAVALAALMAVAALALAVVPASSAEESGVLLLYQFLTGLNTLSTDFTQSVSDAHGIQAEAGSGTLRVQRPNQFRWDYHPAPDPGAVPLPDEQSGQLMVADGKNLWFYDRELAQVTVRPIGAALSSTPIMLLSSTPQQLRDTFEITAGAPRDSLQWLYVKPHSSTADFISAELGFDHTRLARMIVHDHLGQTVSIEFSHSQRNALLASDLFQFKPPAGVDVIGTAQ